MADKYFYRCNDCGTEYPPDQVIYLCPACQEKNVPGIPPKGVLKTLFNYERLKKSAVQGKLFDWLKKRSFLDLMPIKNLESLPPLRIGQTPLYMWAGGLADWRTGGLADKLKGELNFEVYLKDDSQNPTFSFKDRASSLVSAWAKEHDIETIIAASTGNAGSSLAGICASQGQKAIIFVPATAPLAKLTQIVMYGAKIIPVKGKYDDAFELSMMATKRWGYYNRNTAFNPLTIEGKKTVVFELYDQLGCVVPDRVFVPLGDGVVISGVFKGFEDLLNLGIIEKMPVVVGVQASGSPNVANNLGASVFTSVPSKTIADSISVDVPGNFYMTAGYLKKYQGACITVTDEEILEASNMLSKSSGIFTEPASAAAFAGILHYRDQGKLNPGSTNVVLLTGSGLKDLKSVQPFLNIPDAVENDIREVELLLKKNN